MNCPNDCNVQETLRSIVQIGSAPWYAITMTKWCVVRSLSLGCNSTTDPTLSKQSELLGMGFA
jgi:hypothetical protein